MAAPVVKPPPPTATTIAAGAPIQATPIVPKVVSTPIPVPARPPAADDAKLAIACYNRGLATDGNIREFRERYRPRRVTACVQGDGVVVVESQTGFLWLVQEGSGWWLVPDPETDRYYMSELRLAFDGPATEDDARALGLIAELESVAMCTPDERGWRVALRGQLRLADK